ncbi:MAG TPA: cupin domain-containing protein [Bacteroidales bacterium]|nr:cupin domain-containing protein [Bacteroidales bacterium]
MKKYNLQEILDGMEKKPLNKEVFCTTDHLKAQVTSLKAGNSIPPCKMENDVLFYFVAGEGTITVDNETFDFKPGECVVVPHQAESRSIYAKTDLEILAVQGLK